MVCFRYDLDDLFAYDTERIVRIRDRRLGIAKLLVSVLVFAYIVVYEAIVNQGYLVKEEPIGFVVTSLRRPDDTQVYPSYCSSAWYPLSNKLPCLYFDEIQALYPEGEVGSMFITTRMTVTKAKTSGTGCLIPTYQQHPNGTRFLTGRGLVDCAEPPTYEFSRDEDLGGNEYYVGDIENFTVMWRHGIYGPRVDRIEYLTTLHDAKFVPRLGTPFTFLPRATSDVATRLAQDGYVGTNDGDIMTIQKLIGGFAAANNFSLDEVADPNAKCDEGIDFAEHDCPRGCYWTGPRCFNSDRGICLDDDRCMYDNATSTCSLTSTDTAWCKPETYRYKGIVILVMVEYNTPLGSMENLGYRYRPVIIPEAEFKIIQRFERDGTVEFHNRHGIRILFVPTGAISQFSLVALLTTIVSGLALLAVAKVVIESFLMNVLPLREVYNNFKYTTSKDFSEVNITEGDPNGGLTARDYTYGVRLPGDLTAPVEMTPSQSPAAAMQDPPEEQDGGLCLGVSLPGDVPADRAAVQEHPSRHV